MNTKKYNWILYLITATIITTVAVQLYWNYKNYQLNKQRVLNEIQLSLDNSLELYFADLSKKNFLAIVESDSIIHNNLNRKSAVNKVFKHIQKDTAEIEISTIEISTDTKANFKGFDSLFKGVESRLQRSKDTSKHTFSKVKKITQLSKDGKTGLHFDSENDVADVKIFRGKRATDSLKLITGLKSIFIALENDSLNHKKVDSILKEELKNKNITTSYYFNHKKADTLFHSTKLELQPEFILSSNAKSTYLKPDEQFTLLYSNPTYEAFKRSFTGILLSFLLSLAVILSLFYLLKIINQQKELAEIKNDLISNITHEFKTPIATVATAVEALESFNAVNDKEKTKKYLNISSVQLQKLHGMVEKLLETATLDSEKLLLNKEPHDIISLTKKIVQKHQLVGQEKNIQFSTNVASLKINIDTFHFENAISNLVDNAIKYGGDEIRVTITNILNTIEIIVADNGKGIDKSQREKIFDKFYRVPKGNTHDVKGFGIGLYYTKKIIEKHGGTINLNSDSKSTSFKISLPNE